MDVEGDGPSELRTSNDRGWQKLGPHDGPQAAVDDELPEPAKCSLLHECAVLNSRFGKLEEEITELKRCAALQPSHSASASQQPQDDAMAASCASSSLPHKRKTCPQYRVPPFRPFPVNSGKCQWCQRCWSTAEFKANFQLDKNAWEQAMSKLFYGFESTEEGLAGGLYDFIESSGGMPYNVQHSLEQLKTLSQEQGVVFSNLLADKLWKPDQGDDKCWFLFRGGNGLKRYITFGCVRCQRGTDLYYVSPTFWTDFMRYFP